MDVYSGWKSTCRAIFGEEIGELDAFRSYLLEYHYPCVKGKSAISGKDVALSSSRYCKGASVISQDEVNFEKKYAPLSINEIKDIDSLLSALSDRFYYCGNKIFSNSKFVEGSDNCDDSFFVKDSHTIVSSKYVAYSSFIRENCSSVYGCVGLMDSSNIIRGTGLHNSRNFESIHCFNSSDMLFAYYCAGCTQCMFSFNLRSKKYCIGNLELPKGKYLEMREKLAKEVAAELREKKRFHPIFDFAAPTPQEIGRIGMPRFAKKPADGKRLEEAFRKTSALVLGKELEGVRAHEKFLSGHSPKTMSLPSAFGNECGYSDYFSGKNVPKERLVTVEESRRMAQECFPVEEEDSVHDIVRKMGRLAFYCSEIKEENSANNTETPLEYGAQDCHRVAVATHSRRSAYAAHLQRCDAVFGSGMLMVDSSFCLRCHNCVKVTCSMDLDSCTNCARSYFCHNCENVHDSMFCFNTKNLSYAIGNVEVGREQYMEAKKMLLDNIASQLKEKSTIGIDICSMGCNWKGN
ncbi:MAG: hypothetical protein WC861_00735 [Candidatus Micrarchaeia archaeon]|jgi:hypothetical protein